MIRTKERITLRRADVADAGDQVAHFLAEEGLAPRETERLRLTVKRLLERIAARLGAGTECELSLGRRLGRAWISVSWAGAAYDPTAVGRESEGDIWSVRLLTELGLVPEWSWRRGVNRLALRPRRRGGRCLLASLLALALAAGLWLLLPEAWREPADRLALTPFLTLYLTAARAVAAPAFLFSLTALVCGAGDMAAFLPGGRTPVRRFALRTLFCAALGVLAACVLLRPPLAPLTAERAWALLRGAVPPDPLSPLLAGNPAPLALLAAAAGAMLLLLGGRAGRVRETAEQCADLLNELLEQICRASPALVFAAALRALLRGGAELLRLLAPLALCAALLLAVTAGKLAAACLRLRRSPLKLLGALAPPVRAAFVSGSGAASFGALLDNCENALRLPHEFLLNALPAGHALCAPGGALCLGAAAVFALGARALPADAGELALLAAACALLAMTMPRVPGALAVCFALPARLLGLDAEAALAPALLAVLLEPLSAALTAAYLQLELLCAEKAVRASRPGGSDFF